MTTEGRKHENRQHPAEPPEAEGDEGNEAEAAEEEVIEINTKPRRKKRKSAADFDDPEVMREWAAHISEEVGDHDVASAIRGKAYKPGLADRFHNARKHKIEVQDVVIAAGVVVATTALYEAVASRADLPRFGWFDKKDENGQKMLPAVKKP